MSALSSDEIRVLAEADLYTFATLVNPHRVYGDIHRRIFQWWSRSDAKDNQLILLPRDHGKSFLQAVRVAWEITKNPSVTVLYVSATSALAEKQLYAIKNILTNPVYRRYWPEMTDRDEGKREKWTTTEIAVDHPKRKEEGIRDATVFAAGLTTNITGFHCDIAALDDVVVPSNVGTKEGRDKVDTMYSQLASIEAANAKEWAVGTRYDPRDLYNTLISLEEDTYNTKGELTGSKKVYEVFEATVEDSPNRDGTGEFLWPRQRRSDGKFFGFDISILARKRAKYIDKNQYFAQYYNDPNDKSNAPIKREWFQYYDKKHLKMVDGLWRLSGKVLNVTASMDFAFSVRKAADYSAIVTVGMDSSSNIFILDVDRFKTSSIREMFDHVLACQTKWQFRKMRGEAIGGQKAIITEFKNYMSDIGTYFSIDEFVPNRGMGTKEERMDSILTPRYENGKMWHYHGGNCQILEEELVYSRPEHDDIKDALTAAIDFIKPPFSRYGDTTKRVSNIVTHTRFGGIRS